MDSTNDLRPKFGAQAQVAETIVPITTAFSGISTGYAAIMDRNIEEPSAEQILPENIGAELERFWSSYALTVQTIEGQLDRAASENPSEEERDLFFTIRTILRGRISDQDIIDRNEEALDNSYKNNVLTKIRDNGSTAARAIYDYLHPRIQKMVAPNQQDAQRSIGREMQEILYTFLSHYDPNTQPAYVENLRPDNIVFYETAGLGTVARLMDEQGLAIVKGVFVDNTTAASHAPITAKAMRLLLGWSDNGKRPQVENGQKVILDGINGQMIINPSDARWNAAIEREKQYERGYAKLMKLSKSKRNPSSLDDVEFKISTNLGLPAEGFGVDEVNASSICLVRMELWFASLPINKHDVSVDGWYDYAKEIVENANRSNTTFRLPDFAGDKKIEGLDKEQIEIMYGRVMQAILKLRAELPNKKIHLMAPLIDEGSQLANLQARLDSIAENIGVESFQLGSMAESPAFLDELEAHRVKANFISVGSNDMTAATLAINRFDQDDEDRNDPTNLSVLKNLQRPITYRDANGGPSKLPVSICGDIAGQPRFFGLLAGMGYTRLSMPKALAPVMKELVRRINVSEAKMLVKDIMAEPSREKREEMLDQFNKEKLGIRRNGTIDMDWTRPNSIAQPDAPTVEPSS